MNEEEIRGYANVQQLATVLEGAAHEVGRLAFRRHLSRLDTQPETTEEFVAALREFQQTIRQSAGEALTQMLGLTEATGAMSL